MFFNVSEDLGDRLQGYLVPDGFAEQSCISVFDGDRLVFSGACDQEVPSLVQAGRHATGNVGFKLDESNVPGIQCMRNLRIVDAKTSTQIYQRYLIEDHLPHKLLRVDTQLLPHREVDKFFQPKFQYFFNGLELVSHETATQVFELICGVSVYVSGRINLRPFENYFDRDFKCAILINDPYYDMAERLFVLSRLKMLPNQPFSERDQFVMYSAIRYFDGLDLTNPDAVRNALVKAPKNVLESISSPLTRQLVTSRHDEKIDRRAVSAALDMLSRMEVVSLGTAPEEFGSSFCEILGVPHESIAVPSQQPQLLAVAENLRDIHLTEFVLEEDLILYHFLEKSINRAQATVPSESVSDA